MNVLIVGGYSVFVSQLIEKFNKEGWEVYLLTGSKHPSGRHAYVFEQYDFPYDSESIKEIIDSAAPDLIIFTGAYDTELVSGSTRRESMYFMSGLVNILMGAQIMKVPSFVYISSHEVYGESYGFPVGEEEPTTPVSTRGMMIAQGESLVTRYGETTEMDTLVLRLDHMYWLPPDRKSVGEVHARMCLGALKDGTVPASAKRIFSSVYITDAVYAIYEIITAKERKHRIYQITTGEQEDEIEIARVIKDTVGKGVLIKDNTMGLTQRNVMSGQRVTEEFGLSMRFGYQERVRFIMNHMLRNKKDYLKREERQANFLQRLYRRFEKLICTLIPFVENFLMFCFVFLLNNRTAESEYFRRIDVFLLYVVLFAMFYGKRQAILAAVFSSVGFIFRQSYYRTGIEVLVDYNIYIWMAQLFIIGMGVGHLRDSLKIIRDDKDEEIEFLSGQLSDIYDINSSNLKVKNILEDHIISYDNSLGTLYSLTEKMEQMDTGVTILRAAEVLSEVLETDDAAIYKVSNADYCRLMAATTQRAGSMGKSLKYSGLEKLSESLRRNEVFVNRALEEDLPVMAYGLRGERLEYILMVWNLPLEKISLHQINLMKVIGTMIHNSIKRADTYLEALGEKRFLPGTGILNREAFAEAVQVSSEGTQKRYADFSLIRLEGAGKVPEEPETENEEHLQSCEHLCRQKLRDTDMIGLGEDGYLYILLSNTNPKEARTVCRRLEEAGMSCSLAENGDADAASRVNTDSSERPSEEV